VIAARFLDEPRAAVDDLAAFEKFLQKAFARRRRTLENNLKDSYANLKDYLRFLNLEGSRRAETLAVVDLARLFAGVSEGS
jgi:16S rRNA A1518/A1519 N6-dimethyltransferase RsmA/KsgA/DIM1 with predicted DNA glycosylase/AP lyase activity